MSAALWLPVAPARHGQQTKLTRHRSGHGPRPSAPRSIENANIATVSRAKPPPQKPEHGPSFARPPWPRFIRAFER